MDIPASPASTNPLSSPRPTGFLTRLGPLLPLLGIGLLAMVLLSLTRLGHTLMFAKRVTVVDDWGWLFLVGMRMDSVLVAYLLTVPALVLLFFPPTWAVAARRIVALYGTLILLTLVFMELATVRFLDEFDHRPDRLFWEYLNHPKEVAETVLKSAWGSLLAAAVIIPLAAWGAWRWCRLVTEHSEPWRWWVRAAIFPLIGGVLFLGIRGTLSHRPVNISTAAFSNENLLNQLALNSTYTAAYALYMLQDEADFAPVYGKMEPARVISLVRQATGLPDEAFIDSRIPLLHRVPASPRRERPLNLVILLEESLGAQFVGCLGGLPLTPEFDALSKEGL